MALMNEPLDAMIALAHSYVDLMLSAVVRREPHSAVMATHDRGPHAFEFSPHYESIGTDLTILVLALSPSFKPPSSRRPPLVRWRSFTSRLASSWRIRSVSAIGATPELPHPAADDGQQALLTELTRSTQPVKQKQQPATSTTTQSLLKKTFAEVVVPSRALKITNTSCHKYFLVDSPPPAIGAILTGDNGPTLVFTDAKTEALAAPFRFALVGKFSHGAPSYSSLYKLIAGTVIKNNFTESSIVPIWVSFLELPSHLFRKEVLFTVANMIGTPLLIDDATLNQSKLSKAWTYLWPVKIAEQSWASIRCTIVLLKPRLEEFKIQICGETIVQRIEYEKIPHYCSLCKHVGYRDSECYSKGDAPKPPPRKSSNHAIVEKMKGKKVAEEVERGK
ncbi:UNVERIFIED_CONTAM: hypothetical protein Sindi_2501000 [Sesamum indicum]